jgi:hypothetical protein
MAEIQKTPRISTPMTAKIVHTPVASNTPSITYNQTSQIEEVSEVNV